MDIIANDTNVVVLFGNGAVRRFSELVNGWSAMLPAAGWEGIQFILAGTEAPELSLEETAEAFVGDHNTTFFRTDDPPLSSEDYYDIIHDKVNSGNVYVHVICDTDGQEENYSWLLELIRSALSLDYTTRCLYYLMFGRKSQPSEKNWMMTMVREYPGTCLFLTDSNKAGGRVDPEERWRAAEIAVLLNSAHVLPLVSGANSVGYSALNANGSELRRLCESEACRALSESIAHTVSSVSGAEASLNLLPEGAPSTAGLRAWLEGYASEHSPRMSASAVKNAWVTIRMNEDLTAGEAVKRMKRFADINYTEIGSVRREAKELAWRTERDVLDRMRRSLTTAMLSESVFTEIRNILKGMCGDDVRPVPCSFPQKAKKVLGLRIGGKNDAEYLEECKSQVRKSISGYVAAKQAAVFAEELEKVYGRLAMWLTAAQGGEDEGRSGNTAAALLQEIQKELDGSTGGNAVQLRRKYRNYTGELEQTHPTAAQLTDGFSGRLYTENGSLAAKEWRELVTCAGRNIEKRIDSRFRGDFLKVLRSECSTKEERDTFFAEHLKSGPRMYRDLRAQESAGDEVILADRRFTGGGSSGDGMNDRWFTDNRDKRIFSVRTDNAENLTLYPLGNMSPLDSLEHSEGYFVGGEGARGFTGRSLFGADRPARRPDAPRRAGKSLFGDSSQQNEQPAQDAASAPPAERPDVRLEPDEKNDYRLYWKWNGNDETAMVEMSQYGEKVGRIAVIPVRRFKDNGDNMNVTADIMDGKPVPKGTLTVTIRDSRQNILYSGVELTGRRDIVQFEIRGDRLKLKPEARSMMERLVLRSTDQDGAWIYFPLYPSSGESQWLFEGLSLTDGTVTEDPTLPGGQVFVINRGSY